MGQCRANWPVPRPPDCSCCSCATGLSHRASVGTSIEPQKRKNKTARQTRSRGASLLGSEIERFFATVTSSLRIASACALQTLCKNAPLQPPTGKATSGADARLWRNRSSNTASMHKASRMKSATFRQLATYGHGMSFWSCRAWSLSALTPRLRRIACPSGNSFKKVNFLADAC